MTEDNFINWVSDQEKKVLTHQGLSHSFFANLDVYCEDEQFLKLIIRQIYHLVLAFPFHIAGAISTTRDEDVLDILSRNLYSEVGGDCGERHIDIYRRLLKALKEKTKRPTSNDLWKETIDLERLCEKTYLSKDMGTKLGALFAFETMSSPMVTHWHNSLKKLSKFDSFDYMFFSIHIDIEADHAKDIANCCKNYWNNQTFRHGFNKSSQEIMNQLQIFWDKAEKCAKKNN